MLDVEPQTDQEQDFRPAVDAADLLPAPGRDEELLAGIEVAPGAYDRPGASALVAAAQEFAGADPDRQAEVRGLMEAVLAADKEPAKWRSYKEKAERNADPILSERMRTWISTTDDPIMVTARQKLGIEIERPYEVIVVPIDLGLYGAADNDEARRAWLEAVAGDGDNQPSTVFVCKPMDGQPAAVILDQGTAQAILEPSDSAVRVQAAGAVAHEYGHLERDMLTANGVGTRMEELMAARVAGGSGMYNDNLILNTVLNGLSGGEYIRTFDAITAGHQTMNELYGLVSRVAGPKAALALAAIPPGAQYEIPNYAKPLIREGESNVASVYRYLTEAVDITKLAAGLVDTSPALAKWTMEYAITYQVSLHREVIEALVRRLDPSEDSERYLKYADRLQ